MNRQVKTLPDFPDFGVGGGAANPSGVPESASTVATAAAPPPPPHPAAAAAAAPVGVGMLSSLPGGAQRRQEQETLRWRQANEVSGEELLRTSQARKVKDLEATLQRREAYMYRAAK